jgi:hypothetical protein
VIVLGVTGILLNLLEIFGGLSESSGFFISITNTRPKINHYTPIE